MVGYLLHGFIIFSSFVQLIMAILSAILYMIGAFAVIISVYERKPFIYNYNQ